MGTFQTTVSHSKYYVRNLDQGYQARGIYMERRLTRQVKHFRYLTHYQVLN